MNLLKIARVPAVTVAPEARVLESVQVMIREGAGAVVITEREVPVGIFTATDLMCRVLDKRLHLDATLISEVMTSLLTIATASTTCEEALSLMLSNHVRHLPVVDEDSRLRGILSARHLLRSMNGNLSQELQSLNDYFCADGIGG